MSLSSAKPKFRGRSRSDSDRASRWECFRQRDVTSGVTFDPSWLGDVAIPRFRSDVGPLEHIGKDASVGNPSNQTAPINVLCDLESTAPCSEIPGSNCDRGTDLNRMIPHSQLLAGIDRFDAAHLRITFATDGPSAEKGPSPPGGDHLIKVPPTQERFHTAR